MAGELIEIERARELVLERVRPLGAEPVELEDALGRVLAEPAASEESVPGFDNSAMDGFAVLAADTAGDGANPPELRIVDEARAGRPAGRRLAPGEAIAISTGAAIPTGADAVVRVEDTRAEGDRVEILAAVGEGTNVRRAGEDIEAGAELLAAGTSLGAAELGVLASVGIPRIRCAPRPRVAVLCTGDELIGPEEQLRAGAVRNSNAFTVPALAAGAGAAVVAVERVADDPGATREAIARGLGADALVVCGGVSVGEHDHVKSSFAELGVEECFWGVSLKPGKPTWFGTRDSTPVFGLPGNPVSAFVTFLLFCRPALVAMQGADPERVRLPARLGSAYEKPTDRAHAIRCRLAAGPEGWVAEPFPHQGSHVLTSLLEADGLALVGREVAAVEAGETVTVELIRPPAGESARPRLQPR